MIIFEYKSQYIFLEQGIAVCIFAKKEKELRTVFSIPLFFIKGYNSMALN